MVSFQALKIDDFVKGAMTFDGATYDAFYDRARLGGQLRRIFVLMKDRVWRTLREISLKTNAPEASVSAGLRCFRKERYGSHTVYKRTRGDRKFGLWEYQLIINLESIKR